MPSTELIDQILAIVGSVWAVSTALAAALPRTWRITQVLARLATDLKGVLHDEKAVQKRIEEVQSPKSSEIKKGK